MEPPKSSSVRCTLLKTISMMKGATDLQEKPTMVGKYAAGAVPPLLAKQIAVSHKFGILFAIFGQSTLAMIHRVALVMVKSDDMAEYMLGDKQNSEAWEFSGNKDELLAGVFLSPCELYLALVYSSRMDVTIIGVKDLLFSGKESHIKDVIECDEHGIIKTLEWSPVERAGKDPSVLLVHSDGSITLKSISGNGQNVAAADAECACFNRTATAILVLQRTKSQVAVFPLPGLQPGRVIPIGVPELTAVFSIKESSLGFTAFGLRAGPADSCTERVVVHADSCENAADSIRLDECKFSFDLRSDPSRGICGTLGVTEVPEAFCSMVSSTRGDVVGLVRQDVNTGELSLIPRAIVLAEGRLVRGIEAYCCRLEEGSITGKDGGLPLFVCDSQGDIEMFSLEFGEGREASMLRRVLPVRPEAAVAAAAPAEEEAKPPDKEEKKLSQYLGLEPERDEDNSSNASVGTQILAEIAGQVAKVSESTDVSMERYRESVAAICRKTKEAFSELPQMTAVLKEQVAFLRGAQREATEASGRMEEMQRRGLYLENLGLAKVRSAAEVFLSYNSPGWTRLYPQRHFIDPSTLHMYHGVASRYRSIAKQAYIVATQCETSREMCRDLISSGGVRRLVPTSEPQEEPRVVPKRTEEEKRVAMQNYLRGAGVRKPAPKTEASAAGSSSATSSVAKKGPATSPSKSPAVAAAFSGSIAGGGKAETSTVATKEELAARHRHAKYAAAMKRIRKAQEAIVSVFAEKGTHKKRLPRGKGIHFNMAEEIADVELDERDHEWIELNRGGMLETGREMFAELTAGYEDGRAETFKVVPEENCAVDLDTLFTNVPAKKPAPVAVPAAAIDTKKTPAEQQPVSPPTAKSKPLLYTPPPAVAATSPPQKDRTEESQNKFTSPKLEEIKEEEPAEDSSGSNFVDKNKMGAQESRGGLNPRAKGSGTATTGFFATPAVSAGDKSQDKSLFSF